MTNPPPPPASAMGLVAYWTENSRNPAFKTPVQSTFKGCADELAAALSLSEDEREIVSRIAALPSVAKGFEPDAYIGLTVIELDTLRALIARVTAQESP